MIAGASPLRSGKTRSLVRPLIHKLHAYVPGEQPKIKGLIKLNTNENPYPPSPKVLAAIRAAVDGRLRLYPNPSAQALRVKLAKLHHCSPENIIIGNGSDELLALATRTFVEPHHGAPSCCSARSPGRAGAWRSEASGSTVQYFTPSYSLYPVLAAIHRARTNAVALTADFALPSLELLRKSRAWDFNAALTFITTPNAPSGHAFTTNELDALCRRHRGVVVLDEAYVDFAGENALRLGLKYPHVLVARTFSKAYSLCFQRVGYFVGHPELIGALDKLRDSYNVNGLGQVGALATLDDLPYYRANFRRIKATRARLSGALTELGFNVLPSQTNFILTRPPKLAAQAWLEALRTLKILVRWFSHPEVKDYLRITIGTDAEADALIGAARRILNRH
jgi:histidinol-phosphate aminotransferase